MNLTVDTSALLKFYDTEPSASNELGSSISAITGIIGEDIVFGLLRHFFEHEKKEHVEILHKCKAPGSSGYRLDGWILAKSHCYQTEVKNWCASSLSGRSVDESNLAEVAHYNLHHYLTCQRNSKKVWKVLQEMDQEQKCNGKEKSPLLAFWAPVALSPQITDLPPFFRCQLSGYEESIALAEVEHSFSEAWIFSASLYLRSLNTPKLTLCMPRAKERLKIMRDLILK